MKTEDFPVRAQRCMSAGNYGGKGKRIQVPSHPGVPFVGLILLVALPFAASIKQSVPRVKLSHRGKISTLIPLFLRFIVMFGFTLICKN